MQFTSTSPGDCAPNDSTQTSQCRLYTKIVILWILICIVLVVYLGFTILGLSGALSNKQDPVNIGADACKIIIHLAAIISFSIYLYEANIEIENRYGVWAVKDISVEQPEPERAKCSLLSKNLIYVTSNVESYIKLTLYSMFLCNVNSRYL